MKIKFLRHAASTGCTNIANALKALGHDVKKLKISGSTYRGRSGHTIINWGKHDLGTLRAGTTVINTPDAIKIAAHKIKAFTVMHDAGMTNNLPKFTTSRAVAKRWITDDLDDAVYCRTLINASEGRGIIVATDADSIVDAPLYTSKIDVERELRVHVFNGEVIDFAQKKKVSSERRASEGIEGDVDEDIRSNSNGWIFAREGVSIGDDVRQVAIDAIEACGLVFGAVDLAINQQGIAKVYEVNTAPGAEGRTVDSYANAIDRFIVAGGAR